MFGQTATVWGIKKMSHITVTLHTYIHKYIHTHIHTSKLTNTKASDPISTLCHFIDSSYTA